MFHYGVDGFTLIRQYYIIIFKFHERFGSMRIIIFLINDSQLTIRKTQKLS